MPYRPAFETTPRLLRVLEDITVLKTRIQAAAVAVSWVPSLQADASARQAHGSTAIEGNPLTLAEVKILAGGGTLRHAKPRAVQEVLNYFAALRFIEKNSGIRALHVRDVLQLHALVGQKGALDREPVGLFRTYGVRVGGHMPPSANEVPALMAELLDWVNGPGKVWPAVVSSAILHYQFEHIHPFGDGNGRVGRVLAAWELYRRQFDTHHVFAVDEVLLEDRQGYYAALERVRAESQDLTSWLEYSAGAVHEALGRAWRRLQALDVAAKGGGLTLTPKQEILLGLLRDGPLGIKQIQEALSVTKPGAHHILKPLLSAGLVRREGGHRLGKYRLADSPDAR